jgi:hypothetical protein
LIDFQELAAKELDRWATHNPERGMQKASVLAYMARTEALKPEPVQKDVSEIYVIEERTGGGDWRLLEVFTNERKASERFQNLGIAAQSSDGYWEVRARNFPVSKS